MTVIQDLPIGVAGRRGRRVDLAGRARRGRGRRRAAGRVQLPGPGLGLAAADPVAAARRRLRAVHPVDPRHHGRRRRAADRPRHGPVPAVVGARPTAAPPTAPTSATRPTTCSTSSRWRATGRRRSSSARTSARSRTASARPWPSTACCPTGCCGSRTTTRRSGRPRRWPRSPPTTCPRSRGCGPARTSRSSGSTAPAPTRSSSAAGSRCWRTCRGCPTDAPAEQAVERAHQLLAQAPSTLLSATLDDAVGELRRPNMPGTTERPNWSLPLPVLVEDLPGAPAPADGRPDAGRAASAG